VGGSKKIADSTGVDGYDRNRFVPKTTGKLKTPVAKKTKPLNLGSVVWGAQKTENWPKGRKKRLTPQPAHCHLNGKMPPALDLLPVFASQKDLPVTVGANTYGQKPLNRGKK